MAINIFEGARRIAKVITALIVIGFAIAIFVDRSRTVWVTYAVSMPDALPVFDGKCSDGAATESANFKSRNGVSIDVIFCFEPMEFRVNKNPFDNFDLTPSGKSETAMLIPYRIDKATGQVWGNRRFSDEVKTYTKKFADVFVIPNGDEERISNLSRAEALKAAGEYFLGMIASVVGFWAFVWTTGWIVRGFMGIPRGEDFRP